MLHRRGRQLSCKQSLAHDQSILKLFHEISELERLANETADLRCVHCARNHFLAVSAGQYHFYVWPDLPGFSDDLRAWSARDGHIQQDEINVAAVRAKEIDCRRTVGNFEYLFRWARILSFANTMQERRTGIPSCSFASGAKAYVLVPAR